MHEKTRQISQRGGRTLNCYTYEKNYFDANIEKTSVFHNTDVSMAIKDYENNFQWQRYEKWPYFTNVKFGALFYK